jgi:hypothetical protein
MIQSDEICHQHLMKLEAAKRLPLPNFTNKAVEINSISYSLAKEFILQYEWLGTMGSAKYCYGLFIDGHLAGVVCYTTPVSPNGYRTLLGLKKTDVIFQLGRGASSHWAPKWVPSKLIANTLKRVGSDYNVKAVIAYADREAGEIGTIYQACNGIFLGMTNPGGAKTYVINGIKYHPRSVHRKFGCRSQVFLRTIDPNFQTIKIHPKLRYIFFTCGKKEVIEMRERIALLIQPFPKRNVA